jgi:foldase protein PrsA
MRKVAIMLLCLGFVALSCSRKLPSVKLQKDTPTYQLAKDLATKLSILDPDSNKVIVSSKKFDITAGEIVQTIETDPRIPKESLKSMDAERLKRTIRRLANDQAEKKLFNIAANKAGIKVSEAEIDSMLQSQYARYGGEDKFLEMMKRAGMTMEYAREDMRNTLKMNKNMKRILNKQVTIKDEDITKDYNDYKSKEIATVRHILLLTQGKKDAEKKEIYKKMQGLLERARKGEDIAELAKQYSEDPGSKANGGLYEDFIRGRMVKPFDEAAFTVPVGELSNIIETQYGYHILKVISRNQYKSLEEMTPTIKEQIKNRQAPKIFKTYIEELKKDANLKVIDF